MLRIWSWITIVMGGLMGLSPLLHVWQMYSVQSSKGQSFAGVVFLEFGIATWLIYGLMKRDRVLIVSNGIGVVVGLVYLLTIRYYSS
jgi:uncharacterized protein with PQ loop repeat